MTGPRAALTRTLTCCGVPQNVASIETAIRESPMQLNPRKEGAEVLVNIPRCACGQHDFTPLPLPVQSACTQHGSLSQASHMQTERSLV